MPGRAWLILYCTLCCSVYGLNARAVTVRDDSGKQIHFDHPVTRVISLAPNLTELIFDLGAEKHLLATVQYSNYPAAAKRIPRIGSSDSLNLEALLSYHPDLVLAWSSGNNPQQLRAIESLGIKVYRSEPRHLEDISSTLIRLGILLGKQDRAKALANKMRDGIARLEHKYAGRKVIRGFYQIWDHPIYTINGQQIISHIMQICGVRNVFANAPVLAPMLSIESVLAKDPQMIISGGSAKVRAQNFSMWQRWPQITAVHADNLFYIDADIMQRDTPRILNGAEILCQQADLAREHLHLN